MWVFRARLLQLIRGTLTGVPSEVAFTRNLLIAFLPAAVIGGIFIKSIKQVFYHPGVVVVTLVLGGLIMLWVERKTRHTRRAGRRHRLGRARTARSLEITWKQALGVGVAQCLAMIPGTSRSGATIIGGMIAGIQRKTATEFSFFLAMPTMLGAAVYDMYKNFGLLTQLSGIAVGFVAAFLSAMVVVRAGCSSTRTACSPGIGSCSAPSWRRGSGWRDRPSGKEPRGRDIAARSLNRSLNRSRIAAKGGISVQPALLGVARLTVVAPRCLGSLESRAPSWTSGTPAWRQADGNGDFRVIARNACMEICL